jgi:GTP-binding protein HflX
MSRFPRSTRPPRERALVCGVRGVDADDDSQTDLVEACGLVAAAGADVVGEGILQHKQRADPATLFGHGKVQEIQTEVARLHPDLVVVDNDLAPAQARNLEEAWGLRVVDRSELILDIFARRAKTRQARLQVELAQNEYLSPRLRRMWTHLERTEGAIGTRGPGRAQLDADKRLLKKRLGLRDNYAEIGEPQAASPLALSSRSGSSVTAPASRHLNRLSRAPLQIPQTIAALCATLDTPTRQLLLSDESDRPPCTRSHSSSASLTRKRAHPMRVAGGRWLGGPAPSQDRRSRTRGRGPRRAEESVLASRRSRRDLVSGGHSEDDRIRPHLLRNERNQAAVYHSEVPGRTVPSGGRAPPDEHSRRARLTPRLG